MGGFLKEENILKIKRNKIVPEIIDELTLQTKNAKFVPGKVDLK